MYDRFYTGHTTRLAKLDLLTAKLIGVANFFLTLENDRALSFLMKGRVFKQNQSTCIPFLASLSP